MKRRKRMGMHKAPAISSRGSIETAATPYVHRFVEAPAAPINEGLQSAFETTPEKFVAFVNRMTEARSTSR